MLPRCALDDAPGPFYDFWRRLDRRPRKHVRDRLRGLNIITFTRTSLQPNPRNVSQSKFFSSRMTARAASLPTLIDGAQIALENGSRPAQQIFVGFCFGMCFPSPHSGSMRVVYAPYRRLNSASLRVSSSKKIGTSLSAIRIVIGKLRSFSHRNPACFADGRCGNLVCHLVDRIDYLHLMRGL